MTATTATVILPTTGPASMTDAELLRVYREFDGGDRDRAGMLLGLVRPDITFLPDVAAQCVWPCVRGLRELDARVAEETRTREAAYLLTTLRFALAHSPESVIAALGPDFSALARRLDDALEAAGALEF